MNAVAFRAGIIGVSLLLVWRALQVNVMGTLRMGPEPASSVV